MYKLIRLFAPVVLVLYVSTMMVGSCWGEEGVYVNYRKSGDPANWPKVSVKTEEKFELNVISSYKGQDLKEVKLISYDGFKIIDSKVVQSIISGNYTVFTLIAPQQNGTYKLIFEGNDSNGKTVNFSCDIEVAKDNSILFYTLGFCFVILLFLGIGSMGNAGR